MLYIYTPGFSIKNLEEANVICDALRAKNLQVYQHKWRHWDNPNEEWDPDFEVTRILERTGDEAELYFIGKSLGTLVAVKTIKEVKDKTKGLIMLGIPVNDMEVSDKVIYQQVLKDSAFPIALIQNNDDPHGFVSQAKELMGEVKYKLITKEAADHRYVYPEDVLELL